MIRRSRWGAAALLAMLVLTLQACAMSAAAPDNLVTEIDTALQHAGFALNAADEQGLQKHAHHVVNILVGEQGQGFDASFGNPGDGYGALEYARDLRVDKAVEASGWQPVAQNIALWLESASEEALQAASLADSGDTEGAKMHLITAIAFLSAAKGRDQEEAPVAGALALRDAVAAAASEPEPAAPASDSGGGGYY